MKKIISRRSALKQTALSGAAMLAMSRFVDGVEVKDKRKGNVNHSVCRWCYNKIPLEDLCRAAKEMGMQSVELQGPDEWPTIQKYGLTCAMANGAGLGIEKGWNRPELHDQLIVQLGAIPTFFDAQAGAVGHRAGEAVLLDGGPFVRALQLDGLHAHFLCGAAEVLEGNLVVAPAANRMVDIALALVLDLDT